MDKKQIERRRRMRAAFKKHLEAKKAEVAKKSIEKAQLERNAARRQATKKVGILTSRFSKRLADAVDKALVEAETLVKENFPARFVSASLTNLRKQLLNNGIHANFDRRVSRKALRASVDTKCTKAHCDEAIKQIAKATIAEVEAILDSCDKAITKAAAKNFKMRRLATRQIYRGVEKNLYRRGLEFKFEGAPKKG